MIGDAPSKACATGQQPVAHQASQYEINSDGNGICSDSSSLYHKLNINDLSKEFKAHLKVKPMQVGRGCDLKT